MNILVVGDSFAASDHPLSWVNQLQLRLGPTRCLAKGGSSLFYSYMQLKKQELDRYDYVIVLVTNSGRLYFPDNPFINGPDSALNHINDIEERVRDRARAAMDYYAHLSFEEEEEFIQRKILDEMNDLLRNIPHVFQPMSSTSLIPSDPPANFYLMEIIFRQFESVPPELIPRIQNPKEKLHNHMSPHNNFVLCEHFYQLITKGSSNITKSDFVPLEAPIEQWFTI